MPNTVEADQESVESELLKSVMPTSLITRLTHRLFRAPLLRYSIRGEWVEEMVAPALEPGRALCADDWAACDLRQVGGTRARHRPSRRRLPIRRTPTSSPRA